jgi:hypothetical protein
MNRAIDLAIRAAAAVVFVVCVEWFFWRRRRNRVERPASLPPARLRVRGGLDRARVTFTIEGHLDEFTARLLACSIAQLPRAAAITIDLSVAGPIRGKPLAVVARAFVAGRQVRLRGLGEGHEGLLALSPNESPPSRVLPFIRPAAVGQPDPIEVVPAYGSAA